MLLCANKGVGERERERRVLFPLLKVLRQVIGGTFCSVCFYEVNLMKLIQAILLVLETALLHVCIIYKSIISLVVIAFFFQFNSIGKHFTKFFSLKKNCI